MNATYHEWWTICWCWEMWTPIIIIRGENMQGKRQGTSTDVIIHHLINLPAALQLSLCSTQL